MDQRVGEAVAKPLQIISLYRTEWGELLVSQCHKILVTEDNEDTREMLVRVLQGEGYEVDSAANGAEALVKLASRPEATLVLLDMMMPVMDGWTFLKEKRQTAHRVVSISATHADPLEDLEKWQGVDAQFNKPLFAQDLLEIVRKFCGPRTLRERPS